MINEYLVGDGIEVMPEMPDNYVDLILTDPPYGLGFMGEVWDTFKSENVNKEKKYKLTHKTDYVDGVPIKRSKPEMVTRDSGARRAGSYDLSLKGNQGFQQWFAEWAIEALRVAKPGAHLFIFGGTRTFHRLVCAIEDAGWEIRDTLMWVYGSGFPKSRNVSKAIDKEAGVEREVVGDNPNARPNQQGKQPLTMSGKFSYQPLSAPATDAAKEWDGWGTGLKPAWEPITVARKPFKGTVAQNVQKWGTGALNIDACRVGTDGGVKKFDIKSNSGGFNGKGFGCEGKLVSIGKGRWPANLIHDGSQEVLELFPETKSGKMRQHIKGGEFNVFGKQYPRDVETIGDSGSAARFFYCAKASQAERGEDNTHPTIKPLALMRYLCMLGSKEDALVLDPFAGSGSTLIACKQLNRRWIGIDISQEYRDMAMKRIQGATIGLGL